MSDEKSMVDADVQHVVTESDAASDRAAVLTTSDAAAQFEARQHAMTRMEAIKENWRSLLWCMYAFYICITWGYDGLAGAIPVSIAAFRKDFGVPFGKDYAVDAGWQLGWLAGTLSGIVFGGLAAGIATNKYGRQLVIGAGFLIYVGGVFAQVFARNNAHFFVGKLLTGLPMGIFTTVAPTYGSEMAPLNIRGAVSAGMNFAIVLGQCIGYGVMREAGHYQGAMQYKVLFMTQWGFCIVGLAALPFFPESPYWLLAHDREDQARRNLTKLHDGGYDVDGAVAEIKEALARVSADKDAQGSLAECFARDQWRRTLAGSGMFFVQNASGAIWVVGYMAYFMQLAGLAPARAADMSVGLSGLMVVGNMAGWVFVEKFGRRGSALYGSIGLTICLFLIGVLATVKVSNAIYGQIAFMAVWSFLYQATIGAAAWPITAENATSRLRSSSQAVATMTNGLASCIWGFSLPYAINPDQGNLGGKIAFVFGATMAVSCVFVYFCVPETKGRTYIEIDELWTRRVPPRRFAGTNLVIVGEAEKGQA